MMMRDDEVVGVGNWMLTLFLAAIPLVNIVMLLIWSFGSSTPQSKANWARATLAWFAILIGLGIVMTLVSGPGGGFAMSG